MNVNLLGLARNITGPAGYSVSELVGNLRELRDRHRAGDGINALAEFFAIYKFGDEGAASQPPAALTTQGDMSAAFGPADGSGKWLPPSTRVYRTSDAKPHLCENCGQAPVAHSTMWECPPDQQPAPQPDAAT